MTNMHLIALNMLAICGRPLLFDAMVSIETMKNSKGNLDDFEKDVE